MVGKNIKLPQIKKLSESRKESSNLNAAYREISQSPRTQSDLSTSTFSNDTSELRDNIENIRSIQGRVDKLMYTHNTSSLGLLGFLSTNRMIANVEENVNFRYGIDSRYSGGITLIMKNGFQNKYRDVIYHDLYKQKLHLLQEKNAIFKTTNEREMSGLFSHVSSLANYRSIQMSGLSGQLLPIKNMKDEKEKIEKFKKRYEMSLVNPQIRVPWNRNAITVSDIDLILVAKSVDRQIMSDEFAAQLNKSFLDYSTAIATKGGDILSKSVRYEIIKKLNSTSGEAAILKYKELRRYGKIQIVDTGGGPLFSHNAGRYNRRGANSYAELFKAAELGLDIDSSFFDEAMNNSPSALSMSALTQFERHYFLHLYGKGYMNAQ